MSKDKEMIAQMQAWAVAAESVYPLAMALRRYADEMKRLQAELAERAAHLRTACEIIAEIENEHNPQPRTEPVKPEHVAEVNGWNCFAKKEGDGA
jgi:hypothetical protein